MCFATIVQVDLLAVVLVLAAGIGAALWTTHRSDRARSATAAPMQAALDSALDRIRDFATSQGRFISALAEEIQAPVATARVHAELLLDSGSEPATVERYAQSLVADLRHLGGLVESFLQLAQPTAQQDTSRHVPVHVHDVVLAAVKRCRFLAGTRGVGIVPTLAEPRDATPLEVLGDAVLLEAMTENLVRNAVLSSPRGTNVDLRISLVGDEVRLVVHDMGAPIPADQLDEMLHGLLQWSEPVRARPASDLSLAIAMRVAEHHRGSISLVNVPEGGCRFEVQLPRWRGDTGASTKG